MYTINEEKAIVKTVSTQTAKIQSYDIKLSGYNNYYLNDILIGDYTRLDTTSIVEDKQIAESKIGVLAGQTIAVELIKPDNELNANTMQLSF
jgi:hypothetical protein